MTAVAELCGHLWNVPKGCGTVTGATLKPHRCTKPADHPAPCRCRCVATTTTAREDTR